MPKRGRPQKKVVDQQGAVGKSTAATGKLKQKSAQQDDGSKKEDEPSSSASSSGSGSESDSDSEPVVSSDEEGGQDVEGDDEDVYDDINVEFEFFDPKEADFLGLKALLHTFLDGQAFDSSGLVNAVINQTAVGTVVKTSEEDDPIALMTVLNTRTCKAEAWMAELRTFLAAHCPTAEQRKRLAEAFDGPGTGLLLNERLLNSPPSMGPPLVHFLFDELEGAAEDEDSSLAEREEFQLQQYLLCTRAFTDPQAGVGPGSSAAAAAAEARKGQAEDAGAGGSSSKRGGKKAKKQQDQPKQQPEGAPASLVYVRPEDEFLHQHAAWSFTFPVEGRPVAKGDLQPLRLVMCVPADKIPAARRELDRVVGNMATA